MQCKSWSSYPVVNDGFECVLQLLSHPVTLQDVNDAQKEQQALALMVPCWYSARSAIV